jgi:hypothetical protein
MVRVASSACWRLAVAMFGCPAVSALRWRGCGARPWRGPDAAGKADGAGGAGEAQPGRHGGDLQVAALLPAVSAVVLAVTGRDVLPGQLPDPCVKPGLVFFTTRM